MRIVGLRELKNNLSEYVRHVRDGETVTVTDRGEIVAELVPPRQRDEGIPAGLEEMARRGEIRLGKRLTPEERKQLYREMPPVGGLTSKELLDWDRDER